MGASEQVFHYLDAQPDIHDNPGAIALPPFEREIAFQNVDFDYEDDCRLLRNINLRIRKGEVVAIVGSSGAGKTTLANLIPRFFDVSRGRIRFDGHDIRDVTLSSLRAQVGIVTQETILFNDTVYNNICYGAQPPNEAAVREAARVALAEDFILEMPRGTRRRSASAANDFLVASASASRLHEPSSRIRPCSSWMKLLLNSTPNQNCSFRERWPT